MYLRYVPPDRSSKGPQKVLKGPHVPPTCTSDMYLRIGPQNVLKRSPKVLKVPKRSSKVLMYLRNVPPTCTSECTSEMYLRHVPPTCASDLGVSEMMPLKVRHIYSDLPIIFQIPHICTSKIYNVNPVIWLVNTSWLDPIYRPPAAIEIA